MCTNAVPCSKNKFPPRFSENPPKTGENTLFTPFRPVFRKPRWKSKNSFSLRFSENRPKWGKKCLLPCFRGVFRKPHEIFGRLPLFLAESGRGHVRCSDLMIKKYVSANILFCGHDPYWDFGRLPLTKKKVWSRQHTFHQIARIFLICHYRPLRMFPGKAVSQSASCHRPRQRIISFVIRMLLLFVFAP